MKKMGFVLAMKDFFGLNTGQTLTQFGQEVKALSPADAQYFREGLATVGYEIPAA